jgi:hypothetical protein
MSPTEKPPIDKNPFEEGYTTGKRQALANLLVHVLGQMQPGDERTNLEKLTALVAEREQTILTLRRLCAELGAPNDWPVSLHLGDIIEKNLLRAPAFDAIFDAPPPKKKGA